MTYFEYFSEVEERFVARRGSALLLSTLDWALIETWRDAGVPLAAVLRGIDDAFDKHETRKARAKGRLAKVNGLAWCAQAVMGAASAMAEAAVGLAPAAITALDTGFETARVAGFLEHNAALLENAAETMARSSPDARPSTEVMAAIAGSTVERLRELASGVRNGGILALDELDRTLTVLEERLSAATISHLPEAELVRLREDAERALTPLRARLGAVQLRQVRESFVHKQLFATLRLPRLSLFYMPQGDPEPKADAGPAA